MTPRPKISLANGSPNTVEEASKADLSDAFLDGTQVRLLLEDLHAQQENLVSVIESLRVLTLQAHPNLGRFTAELEATSTQALVEVDLLIRHTTALLRRQEKPRAREAAS